MEEYRVSDTAYFITLTYDDEHLLFTDTDIATLHKRDLQLFFKRLRKIHSQISKEKIRYYAVGEYGTRTKRPHYHVLLFNCHSDLVNLIADIWKNGYCDIGKVTSASIHYVTKYHVNYTKKTEYENLGIEPEFAIMSRKPGIGHSYLSRNGKWNKDNGNVYVMNNGYAQRMPRYYKMKIFSEMERQQLAEEAMSEVDKQYWKEYQRLYDLGIEDPDKYMEESRYLQAQSVKHKLNKNDLF